MRTWEQTKRTLFNEDPVFLFAKKGDIEGIKKTVNVMNLESRDAKGYTPLMLAVCQGHFEAVELFLSLPADIHTRDNNGNSPLMAATFYGHVKIVELLLKHGADPWAANYKKQTALLFARTFKHTAIEKLLSSLRC